MQNATISEASPRQITGNISEQTTSDLESGNGAQGASPQEVNRSNLDRIMLIVSPIFGSAVGGLIANATTNGLSSVVNEHDRGALNLLYIPCVALSALTFGLFAKKLIEQQERERADNRRENQNARNSGMSSAPEVGLLSPDTQAYVTGVELVHATIHPSVLAEGGVLLPSGTTGAFTDTSSPRVEIRRPSTAEESKVADNPAVVFTFSSDRQVSDLLHDSNKSVLMVVGAPAGSVSALTIQFSGDNAQGAKQNDEKNKPLDLRNDPNSVRFMVAAIERQKEAGAAEVKSNSR
jgi:hypothetical protein